MNIWTLEGWDPIFQWSFQPFSWICMPFETIGSGWGCVCKFVLYLDCGSGFRKSETQGFGKYKSSGSWTPYLWKMLQVRPYRLKNPALARSENVGVWRSTGIWIEKLRWEVDVVDGVRRLTSARSLILCDKGHVQLLRKFQYFVGKTCTVLWLKIFLKKLGSN